MCARALTYLPSPYHCEQVSDEALRSWGSYRAHLQLPKHAPDGLKPRDFLRVHRGLDNQGDGLVRQVGTAYNRIPFNCYLRSDHDQTGPTLQVRMQDVREMLARLGLKLSVLVRADCTA